MIEPSLRPKGAVMVPSKGRTEPFAMARYSLVILELVLLAIDGGQHSGTDIMLGYNRKSGVSRSDD